MQLARDVRRGSLEEEDAAPLSSSAISPSFMNDLIPVPAARNNSAPRDSAASAEMACYLSADVTFNSPFSRLPFG